MSERMSRIHIVIPERAPRFIYEQMKTVADTYPTDISLQQVGQESVSKLDPHVEVVIGKGGDGFNQHVREVLEQHMEKEGRAPIHVVGTGGSEMGFRKTLLKSDEREHVIVTMDDLLDRRTDNIPVLQTGKIAGQSFTVSGGVGKIAEAVARLDNQYRERVPRNTKRVLTMIHAYLQVLASDDTMDPATEMYFIAQQVDPLPPFPEQKLHSNNLVTKLSIEGESKVERVAKLGLFFGLRAMFRSRFPDSLATVRTALSHELSERDTYVNVDGEVKEGSEQDTLVKRSSLAIPTAVLVWKR